MACAPSKDLARVFAVCIKKAWVLSYPLSAQRRLWSDWMPRLSWVFTGRTATLLVLSWGGSIICFAYCSVILGVLGPPYPAPRPPPPHPMTKPTKWHVPPAKTQIGQGIRPVWSESSLSAWRSLGSLATHWAHSEDWSDWANAQADLSLRWAHRSFCWFCHAAAHMFVPVV